MPIIVVTNRASMKTSSTVYFSVVDPDPQGAASFWFGNLDPDPHPDSQQGDQILKVLSVYLTKKILFLAFILLILLLVFFGSDILVTTCWDGNSLLYGGTLHLSLLLLVAQPKVLPGCWAKIQNQPSFPFSYAFILIDILNLYIDL